MTRTGPDARASPDADLGCPVSAAYVRHYYGVDYKRGERLVVYGRTGVLVSFPGQYLGVRLDGERHTSRCHPTWRVQREGGAP